MSVACRERVNLKCQDRCLLAWLIKLVCEVEKVKNKSIGQYALMGAGEGTDWNQQKLTRCKLAVKLSVSKCVS